MNLTSLWSRARLPINKKQTTNLMKTWFLKLVSKKEQKGDKSEFVTKFAGIIVTKFFMKKYFSNCYWNLCYIVLFFSGHLNHKTVNKTTCITPSVNPHQLWPHWLKSFRTVAIILWGFQDFLIYGPKYFSSN